MNSAMKFPVLHLFLAAYTFPIFLLLTPLSQTQLMTPLLQSAPMTASLLTSVMTQIPPCHLWMMSLCHLSKYQIYQQRTQSQMTLPNAATTTQTLPVQYCIIPNGSIHNSDSQLTGLDAPTPINLKAMSGDTPSITKLFKVVQLLSKMATISLQAITNIHAKQNQE